MDLLSILRDINFWIPALGVTLLGSVSGMVGSISVLRRQSLIGDSIGHSVLPGIILSFMLFHSRSPLLLMLGAIAFGLLSYALIQYFDSKSKTTLDTSLAIILSSMFGLGMVFMSYIQGNVKYQGASQAGLNKYIFGQAAFTDRQDVILIVVVALVNLALLLFFYKEIQLFIFDNEYCALAGFSSRTISFLVLLCSLSLISVGLRIVGAILISSMLIAPAVAALQWSNRFSIVLLLSGAVGGISAFGGTVLATIGFPNGPIIILLMTMLAFISLVLGKVGRRKGAH